MLAPIAAAATGQATSPRRYSFKSQVPVPSRSFPPPRVSQSRVGTEGGREGRGGQGATHSREVQVLPRVTSSWDRKYIPLSSFLPMSLLGPLPVPSQSSYLASFGLVTGADMAVLSEGQPGHFPETRNPDPGHGPRNQGPGAEAGGHRGLSSSHPRPATR